MGAFDKNLARLRYGRDELALGCQLADQKGRPPIDKALRDARVQRVRKPILDAAGALLPCRRIFHPVAAMGDVGPGADVRDARHQGVDVTIDTVEI